MSKIHAGIPYSINKDFGTECNRFMARIPDGDYGCIIDHDVHFTTYDWYKQMTAIINKYPDIDCFNVRSNRINCRWQQYPTEDTNDFLYHWKCGHQVWAKYGDRVRDCTNKAPMSGLVTLVKKSSWKAAGGFPRGLLGIDNDFHKRLRAKRMRVYLMEGIYVYHFYRDNNRLGHKHLL